MIRSIGNRSVQGAQRQQEATPPRLPDAFQAQPFLLSQSGAVLPIGSWPKHAPVVPKGLEGMFEKMEVMALDPAGVHGKNTFSIDEQGVVSSRGYARPLGHVPYQISLIAKDGSRYSATIDISPSKTGVSHQGYETISGLKLQRERGEVGAPDAALGDVASEFARSGGAQKEAPTLTSSPLGVWFQNRS